MRKTSVVLFVVSVIMFVAPVFGQHDLANFTKNYHGQIIQIPWYTYNSPSFAVDARYNFDWADSGTFLIGKPMRRGTFTPYVGVVVGRYRGVTAQFTTFNTLGASVTLFTLNQVTREVSGGYPDTRITTPRSA